jgi:hypothetical protein
VAGIEQKFGRLSLALTLKGRRFPPPWIAEDHDDACLDARRVYFGCDV